jgi:YggT family protein
LPMSVGGIDFSPVIVIMGIIFLQSFLVPTLRHLAM